jgi:hypothetical protein
MLTKTSYRSVWISSAKAMVAHATELPPTGEPQWWMFRGTARPYPMQTSLERALLDAGIPLKSASEIERQMLKEFKRRAHFYVDALPSAGDLLGWLALMQHYGAPTRLLDWTYSFYVAAFFALSDAVSFPKQDRRPAIVWALHRNAFKLDGRTPRANDAYESAVKGRTWKEDLGRAAGDFLYDGINAYLSAAMEFKERGVWSINAFQLNERLSVQKGVFMCPGNIEVPFEDNLIGASRTNLIRFEFSTAPKARREMLAALDRMNISNTSLFPGLDGFAKSLRQLPWTPYRLRPKAPSHKG